MSKVKLTIHTMHMITEEPVSSKVTPFLDARSYGSVAGILNVFFSDLVESFHRKKEDLTYEQLLISQWYERSSFRLSKSTSRQIFLSEVMSFIPDGEENKKTSEEAEGEEK